MIRISILSEHLIQSTGVEFEHVEECFLWITLGINFAQVNETKHRDHLYRSGRIAAERRDQKLFLEVRGDRDRWIEMGRC